MYKRQEIRESSICFAEITTNNPNVWYELGYAFACNKDVIMVCSDEREDGKFPFDIQHRHVITYKTKSKSDFSKLEDTITEKINAMVKTATPVIETEGLKSNETKQVGYNELQAIFAKCTKEDWLYDDWKGIYVYKGDLHLRIENVRSEGPDQEFCEEWACKGFFTKGQDDIYRVYYGTSLIKEYRLVAVDGCHAILPIPTTRTSGIVTKEQYKIAQIVDILGTLDDYMRRAKLVIKE